MRSIIALSLAALAAGLAGCNSSNCGPSNCTGCCDANGSCQGASAANCGANGNSCIACSSGQQCVLGQCSFTGGNSSATNTGGNSSGNGTNGTNSSSGTATATNGNSTNGTDTATNGTTTNGTSSATAGNTNGTTSAGNTTTNGTTTAGNTTTNGTTTAGNTTTNGATTAGSTNSGNTTGTTTGTSATSSTTSTTSTNGGTTTGSCNPDDVFDARFEAPNTPVCLSDAVVVLQTDPGGPDGGGTVFDGKYYVANSNGDVILVFKAKAEAPTGDPLRGNAMNAEGVFKPFPYYFDGGYPTEAQLELSGAVTITDLGPSTLPTPKFATFADLDVNNPNTALVGSYVLVPAGSYTENFAEPGMQHVSATATYQDGFSLSDGLGHTIWVDTFDYMKGSTPDRSCMPTDGGEPDLSSGGFVGVFDYATSPSGPQAPMIFFGDCRDLQ